MSNPSFPFNIEDLNDPALRAWTDEIRRAATGAEVLQEITASSDATLDIISLNSKYIEYTVQMFNLLPATDDVQLHLRMDSDNGDSFDSGATDYSWVNLTKSVNGTSVTERVLGDDTDTKIVFINGTSTEMIGNAANEGLSGEIKIFNPLEAVHTQISFQGTYKSAAGDTTMFSGSGIYHNTTATTAVQLLMSSGNIASGSVRLIGTQNTRG